MRRRKQETLAPPSSVEREAKSLPQKRVWLLLGSFTATVILGAAGAMTWRHYNLGTQVQAVLPARPDLASQPAIFGELLARAEQNAKSSRTRIEGMTELGSLYHANGFTDEAEVCWRFLQRAQPAEARWSYYLADLRRSRSDYPGMIAHLEETLKLAPDYAPARLQLANLQFKSGELADAQHNYRLRLEAMPQDPYARLGLVRVALQRVQPEEAKSLLERLLKDAPHFSTGHNLYAELLAAAGDASGASRHRWLGRETLRYREPEDPWLDALQAACYDYERLCVLGTVELQTERLDRARTYFEKAIRIKPTAADAYELLASVYLKQNDAARARDLLEQVLPQLARTKSSGVFVSLSLAYRLLSEPAEAVRVARAGLHRVGEQPELLNALGLALAETGEHEEAVKAWRAASNQNPGDASTNYNLAKSYLALRRLDEALDALDRSLTLQPSYLPTLLLRGEIELEAGHLDLADKYLRPAFESHPEEPQARRLLATWHMRMGAAAESQKDFAAIERHYLDALTLDNSQPDLLLRLGLFYVTQGRPAEALAHLENFHRSQPENALGCLLLGQAYAATNQRENAREILTKGQALAEQSGNAAVAQRCRSILQQL